ncbi:No hit [Brucella canis HSK A52141]|nr:No hit [Brucella canis HSK A52141]
MRAHPPTHYNCALRARLCHTVAILPPFIVYRTITIGFSWQALQTEQIVL